MAHIKISVRNMVEFVYRSGNIDSGYMSSNRAREGIRIHKKIQALRKKEAKLNGGSYESEYALKASFAYKDYDFTVEGRADGVLTIEDGVVIEEIKSTLKDLEEISGSHDHWHWAQAKCYAYMICAQKALDSVSVMVTYCHVDTDEFISFEHNYTASEIEGFFFDTIELYYLFAKMDAIRIEKRNKTAACLDFPFDNYRAGQRELAVSVYAAIMQEKNLFAHAPTGIGKTVSTVYPSVKALEKGLISKIFYLTSRNTGKIAATDCFRLLENKGLNLISVNLTAKAKTCFLGEPACNPISCAYAKGHFDRVNNAILDIITNETLITKDVIEAYATRHNVCPFEYSLDITMFCDCIICDYNYVYDPTAKLKRYFSPDMKNDFAILIDEAHNLVDRAREMYSVELKRSDFTKISEILKGKKSRLKTISNKIKSFIGELKSAYLLDDSSAVFHALPESFYHSLADFCVQADKWLASNEFSEDFDSVMEIYFNILDFLRILEIYDDSFICLITKEEGVRLKIICLDPSFQIAESNKAIKTAVYFSATLNQMDFYSDILGGKENDFRIFLSSPFSKENLCVLVNTAVSTKYKDRENSYEKIAELIYTAATAKKGNYMAFFPSYAYMENVYNMFSAKYEIDSLMQIQGDKSEAFLERFTEENEDTFVGFAVLGAGYSEGIDLKGDKLIGAIIVGVGLPMLNLERDTIKDYYSEKNDLGYEYAYQFPGMNKVLQAGGRVIRKESDKGIVFLIDSRFLDSRYRNLYPKEWLHYKKTQSPKEAALRLLEFWGK